jgi:hypothetical protein
VRFYVFAMALFRGLVIAGLAAGFAVHEAVSAEADVDLRLTEAAELLALALSLGHIALAATVFGVAGSGRHRNNVALGGSSGNVPLVTSREITPEIGNCVNFRLPIEDARIPSARRRILLTI